MKITKTQNSRLGTVDIKNAGFGVHFSDHMLICKYSDEKWGEPEIIPYGNLELSPATMGLHYGQAFFEGMKAYKDGNDDVFLFRPEKNWERACKSAERLAMPLIPQDLFVNGIKELVNLDRDWVPTEKDTALYIRPFMFASEGFISARPAKEYLFIIITSMVGSYYDKPLKVKVSDYYTRAVDGGVGFTKCAGNYGASFYPTKLANEEGFDQIIWTDSKEHKYFEESGTMNVMVRIGNKLITPPTSTTILSGVTRDSLVQIAKHNGWDIKEERISIDDIINAHKAGELKEIFGCGTAVVINRYSHITYQDNTMELPTLSDEESFAFQLKKQLVDIQTNKSGDPFGWRIKI